MILQALIQGGWSNKEEDEEKDKSVDNDESAEHSLVSSILKSSDDNDLVQSALSSQTVSNSKVPPRTRVCTNVESVVYLNSEGRLED